MYLPTALGCQFWEAETSAGRRFLGSSQASKALGYAWTLHCFGTNAHVRVGSIASPLPCDMTVHNPKRTSPAPIRWLGSENLLRHCPVLHPLLQCSIDANHR